METPKECIYEHNFLAVCPEGHKRNFYWYDYAKEPLKNVTGECIMCNFKTVEFDIRRYWGKVEEIKEPYSGDILNDKQKELFPQHIDCGWMSASDNTCLHPKNQTPECHQYACPIIKKMD
jgi:hypothetical protein